jgi:hypothetical protein
VGYRLVGTDIPADSDIEPSDGSAEQPATSPAPQTGP